MAIHHLSPESPGNSPDNDTKRRFGLFVGGSGLAGIKNVPELDTLFPSQVEPRKVVDVVGGSALKSEVSIEPVSTDDSTIVSSGNLGAHQPPHPRAGDSRVADFVNN